MLLEKIYAYSPIFFQNVACSLKGHQLKTKRYSSRFFERLSFLRRSSLWNVEKMRAYQIDKFNEILAFSIKTVPYYAHLFKAGRIPNRVKSFEELEAFPVIEKRALKANPLFFITSDKSKHYTHMYTSGTTGAPLKVTLCQNGLIDIFAMLWRQRLKFGVNFGDSIATFNGRVIVPYTQCNPPFWRHNIFLNQTLFSQYHTSQGNLKFYAEQLNQHFYKLWFGYPSFIGLIACYLEKNSIKLKNPPKLVQTGSEVLFHNVREKIERYVKTTVKDNYGCTEGCASITECEYGKMHVDNEMCIVELEKINEDDSHITGHLIFTGLSNFAMPLIRYRIGDIGTLYKSDCECGRSGPVFHRIDGRIDDVIVTPRGSIVGRLDHLFKGADNVEECQIIQTKVNEIVLNLVRRQRYATRDERKLRERIKHYLGADIRPIFNYVREIPRLKNGKFRAVINRMKYAD